MSSHNDHDNHHSEEKKPVAFRTPMILGLVTLLAIILLVSTCDKKHGCCEDGAKCEDSHSKHGAGDAEEHSKKEEVKEMEEKAPVVTDSIAKVDTTHTVEHAGH